MEKLGILNHEMAKEVMVTAFSHLPDWPIKSPEAFRNALIGINSMIAINPLLNITERYAIDFLHKTIKTTVQEGRMIDFGYIPNELFKVESARSQDLFTYGELVHPFNDWLGLTSWEGGANGYHVSPHPDRPSQILVMELYGIKIPPGGLRCFGLDFSGANIVLLYDIVSVWVAEEGIMVGPYTMTHEPSNIKPGVVMRGANSLEPLITMLKILADASIPVIHSPAPEKLNKIRVKKGQLEIPAHTIVHTGDYVSSFQTAKAAAARVSKGGHHASPIPHWRRSHPRILASGRVVRIRASKVNWRSGEELHRLFYKVPTAIKVEKPNDQDSTSPEQG